MTFAPALKNGASQQAGLASLGPSSKPAEFQFERPDWVLFRSPETLSQKAGVPKHLLRRLALKELADNALDAGGQAAAYQRGDRYVIHDNGPGIGGSPEEIARLFSINRPMVSTKLWRLPSRGALGNGLRVVAGAVAASGGRLTVCTRNRRLILVPQDDGSTAVLECSECAIEVGTWIEITFGPALPYDVGALDWAQDAIRMSAGGCGYDGRPSPFWYDGDTFYELLQAGRSRPVRDLVSHLDGCSGAKAGKIAAAFKNVACADLSRDQARSLLIAARSSARPVRAERLGAVGELDSLPPAYARAVDVAQLGSQPPRAEIPFVVEAWAHASSGTRDEIRVKTFVNRTPVAGDALRAYKTNKAIHFQGCGLRHAYAVSARGSFDVVLNITTPYCPITTDGKEPDLSPFVEELAYAIDRAISRARRAMPKPPTASERSTQKSVILGHLDEAIAKASGDGVYRFAQRQLFYAVRPFVIDELGIEPSWGNFEGIITDYEEEHGDIPGMYRDPRGTLYHPHTGEDIALGTLAVEQYERPGWIFNKVLYIEKEAFSKR